MPNLKCDVLVIGAGLAGCWAAVRARELAPKVILVDIAKVSRSGKSSFSGAGILAPEASDDLDAWQQEVVEKGQYLGDQDWVRIMLEEQTARLEEMGRWGMAFEYDKTGKVLRHFGLNHTITKITTVDSLQMMEAMRKRLEQLGVTLLERVMITDLLTSDGATPTEGSVVGAVGFNTRTGAKYAINAGATVVATGTTGLFGASGEGVTQAFKVGAEIVGMEFSRCFDEMWFVEKTMGIGLHLNTFQRLGWQLVNSKGYRFMADYFPDQMERGRREDVGLAMACEGMQGRAPLYVDMRHVDKESMDKLHTLPTTAWMVNTMEEDGHFLAKEKIKCGVASGRLWVTVGGIKNNIYGESNIPGLYAAGEAGGFPAHGTYSVGGVNLASCCVGGYRAGEYAAKYARENGCNPVITRQSKETQARSHRPLRSTSGLNPDALADEVHGFLSPARISIFKTAQSIGKVLDHIGEWKNKAGQLQAEDPYELVKANRLVSYIECIDLVFRGHLVREETRANNIRIDFPYKDNINWLKWIVQSTDSRGKLLIKKAPVPLHRYPVKPGERTRIPAEFPFVKVEGTEK